MSIDFPADAPARFWFRRDLRLADNPGLTAALQTGRPLICVHVDDPELSASADGAAPVDAWRAASLDRLAADIAARGGRLLRRRGAAGEVIADLVAAHGVAWIGWTRLYDPASITRDSALKSRFKDGGLTVHSVTATLMREPWEIRTNAGTLPRTFAAFWRRFQESGPFAPPLAAPDHITPPPADLGADDAPANRPALSDRWTPGEAAGQARLAAFAAGGVTAYGTSRELFENDSTSLLAPHLAQGELSPRQVWHAANDRPSAEPFLRQIAWREFAHALLFEYPHMPEAPIRPEFSHFPWADDAEAITAWKTGRTGYPLVDAAMRQLAAEGFINNRLRMVVASFLTKHLLVPWQVGEAHFRAHLIDADHANNAMGWQWTAGCGVDAAPYFRIFNPIAQGQKFDPAGRYVARWVPELGKLPGKFIHSPWEAPPLVLADAGVRLGDTYPQPMIAHAFARQRALDAMAETKAKAVAAA